MISESSESDQVEFCLDEFSGGRAAQRRPSGQRESEVLRESQGAEESTGLKKYAEARDSFVKVRLSNTFD